ncbi:hypothetical protein [Pantoea sp. B65]|uniref:hypothetical protein n=1 Tax=Pantoea sp. B65 TaxID=2813359 RepID=UPI0039B46FBB
MEPVASGSHSPFSGNSSSVSSPGTSVPSLPAPGSPGNYLLTLSAERLSGLINDLDHNGLWNPDVMELVPFIALNLPGWEQVALRIEDGDSNGVLFLPALAQDANMLLVIRQLQNQHGQLVYQPAVRQNFEEVDSGEYGDHFLTALYASRYNLLPGQISHGEIQLFRHNLAQALKHNGECQNYINQAFYHWMPVTFNPPPPYRGSNDLFEGYLPGLGYHIISRGEDVYRQLPQIREALILFDNSLHYTLNHSAQNTSRLATILARQLGIRPPQVTPEMLELARTRLADYYQLTQRYLNQDASQILLSLPNNQRDGVDAEAFPGDSENRIVFTTINNNSSFLKIVQVVSHEISHMMPGRQSSADLWYAISYGVPDELRRTMAGIAAMSEENDETASLQGFAELVVAKICDGIMMKTASPAGMRRTQFLEMLERIRSSALDNARWRQFLQYARRNYPVSLDWLNQLRQDIYNHHVWSTLADITGLHATSPAGLLQKIHANKRLLLKVILQNADSLVTLVLKYADNLPKDFERRGHRFIRRSTSEDSFDTLSNSSITAEPDYQSLAHPETLTPYQLHGALEDLAQAATTLADTSHAASADMVAVRRFLAVSGRDISARIGYLGGHQSLLPGISTTLYLTILRKMLTEKLLTPQQILRIILPQNQHQRWSLSDAVAREFWRDGKLLAWQQLLNDCLSLLSWPVRNSYQDELISSPRGRAFLSNIAAQLGMIAGQRENYAEVINALMAMIKSGLIPFSYQIAIDIIRLNSGLTEMPATSSATTMDIFTLLRYVKEFGQQISDEQIDRLGRVEMLAGLATQHGWYVVYENEEGEAELFFDPAGNNMVARPPQLANNELVLVVRADNLDLYQQSPAGPVNIASNQWLPGDNHSLIAAVQQLTGFPLTERRMVNQQFLRGMSVNSSLPPVAAEVRSQGWLSGLSNTGEIDKHAGEIHRHLDEYYRKITADDRFTQRRKETPLHNMQMTVNQIRAGKKRKADEAELDSISDHLEQIYKKLQLMNSYAGVDRRLEYFNTLPPHFHAVRQHSLNLTASRELNQRHKNDDAVYLNGIKRLKKSSEQGMGRTLRTRGRLHSLITARSDGAPSRYQASLQRRRPSPVSEAAAPSEGMWSLLFGGALGILASTPFSERYAQQCALRDAQREQQWQQQRAERDSRVEQLQEERQVAMENLCLQLQQWGLQRQERAGRRQHLEWLTDDHPDGSADTEQHQTENAETSENSINTPVNPPAGPPSGAPQPQRIAQYVSDLAESSSEALAQPGGVLLNSNSGQSVTQLLAPGSVTRQPHAPVLLNPGQARRPVFAANSGTANIMNFIDMVRRNNRADPPAPERLPTLRLSTRHPPARAAALRTEVKANIFLAPARLTEPAVDAVRQAHRNMVVNARHRELFSPREPTAQRLRLNAYLRRREPVSDPVEQARLIDEEARRQHRRMVVNSSRLSKWSAETRSKKR